jgi:hypothetical protein
MIRHRIWTAPALLVGLVLLPACGGGSSSPTPIPTPIPLAQVAGNYTLTLTASPVCADLPAMGKTTTYAATVTQTDTSVAANLTGNVGTMVLGSGVNGTVSGNSLDLTFAVSEQRIDRRNFYLYSLVGRGTGVAQGTTISGHVNGILSFASGVDPISCNATDHRFTFSRQ